MWNLDFIQFARLLDSLNAVGLSQEQTDAVAKSLEIAPKDVRQIMNRAAVRVEDLKPLLLKKAPLSEDQVSEELAENGKVEALVAIELEDIMGYLDEEATENLVEDLMNRASAVPMDNVEYGLLFSDKDTLYIKVTTKAEEEADEEEEEESDVEPA